MDEATFWKLIETARDRSTPGTCEQAEELQMLLEQLSPGEIISFARLLTHFRDMAYDWNLWAAAYIIGGGCSDDGFDYFRAGLIAAGRETFFAALADPETLADLPEPGVEPFEEIFYVAGKSHEAKTGRPLPRDPNYRHPAEPKGESWDEDKVNEMYPRLAKRYGA